MNGYELLAELERVVKNCIYVPNEKLPESFRDNRTDCVSLVDLEKKCENVERGETEYQEEKREKDRRIEMYAAMIDNGQEIVYLTKGM